MLVTVLGAADDPSMPAVTLASSSGDHAWWLVREGERWLVQHAARSEVAEAPIRRDVARFDDEPVAIVCERSAAWLVFRGVNGRSEVLGFQAVYNPASRLWFSVPAAGRLFASLPTERVESAAALEGEPWVLEAGSARAWRLRGEQWQEASLPAGASGAAARRLLSQGGALWCVTRMEDGSCRRWKRDGSEWREVPVQATGWTDVVPGADMLTLVIAGRLAPVQAGTADPGEPLPTGCVALGWGEGILALRVVDGQAQGSVSPSPHDAFGPFMILSGQRSGASRWYHLPLLGVLSLAALMLAGSVRVLRPESTSFAAPPMVMGRRAAALAIDLFPMGAASVLAFDTGPAALWRVPLWTTDIADSAPFMAMVAAGTAFGFLEEAVGSRSLGKRLMGGCVRGRDGAPAGWLRHAVRNLLKALVLVSPVLALPALSRRRHEGIPEVVSGTVVISG